MKSKSTAFSVTCISLLVAVSLLLSACNSQPNPSEPTVAPNIAIELASTATPPAATPTSAPTPIPIKTIWIDPVLPTDIYDALLVQLQQFAQSASNPTEKLQVSTQAEADLRIVANGTSAGEDGEGIPLITRTLAVAAPFPTVPDGITFDALKKFWSGDVAALAELSGDKQTPPTLFLDPNTRAALVFLLGKPAETPNIQMVSAPDVLATTWAARPTAFAILPFDQLEARWKLLQVDGINLFEREADMSKYPLTLSVRALRAQGNPDVLNELNAAIPAANNRDLSKMAIVAMTGVTALVRGTAVRMEEKGITYPAEKIRDWLTTADVTHISNEVSFYEDCPAPSFDSGLRMCSDPRYMELLRYVGTDVVELTGNHSWDYGASNMPYSLDLYDKEGWKYFGGGRTLADAMKPITMTVNGNRIAFIGCNYFGVNWAHDNLPGSAPCSPNDPKDLSFQIEAIKKLKAEGYSVIATLQYAEYYFYESTAAQRRDFAALREAGAVVVNGSQGHFVQAFDVNAQGFIHWGTGNLFFGDQEQKGTKQTFVDRQIFYDNKYLGVDLRSALIQDESQPVPMTPEQRAELLNTLFDVSRFQ